MSVWGVSMVRDEVDVIRATVGQMARQVGRLLIADNGSTDGTREELDRMAVEFGGRLIVVDDPEPGYYQSAKMTGLARRAVAEGASWVVPFDADEWWYCPHAPTVEEFLEARKDRCNGVVADIYNHYATALDDRALPVNERMGWRDVAKLPLHKMAGRAAGDLVVTQGNHHVEFAAGERTVAQHGLVIRHFPYRSVDQLIRKVRNGAAAYAATAGLAPDAGAHWRKWGAYNDEEIRALFVDWYWRENPRGPKTTSGGDVLDPLIFDPAPA